MTYLSGNHKTNLTLWKWKGFVAVITAIVFLIPAMALAQVPVVDAGPDQTIYLGDSAMLHGTATNDPGVWLWEVISAPSGSYYSLAGADTADADFSTDTEGDYVITFTAWNYSGWSIPDALVVTVVQNLPPTAQAAATPISGAAPLLVEFDGTGSSDPEEGDLLYDWDFRDGTFESEVAPSHTYDLPGVYEVILLVVDERGLTDVDIIQITVTEPTAYLLNCVGFEPPMDNGPVTVKKNRALPLKAYLYDAHNSLITDTDIVAPPVLQVLYSPGISGEAIDVTDAALTAGEETEGNEFYFDFIDEMKWRLNLKLKNTYTASGTYQLYMVSGDDTEYTIDPTCVAEFVIE